jgi:hypothetical protein
MVYRSSECLIVELGIEQVLAVVELGRAEKSVVTCLSVVGEGQEEKKTNEKQKDRLPNDQAIRGLKKVSHSSADGIASAYSRIGASVFAVYVLSHAPDLTKIYSTAGHRSVIRLLLLFTLEELRGETHLILWEPDFGASYRDPLFLW